MSAIFNTLQRLISAGRPGIEEKVNNMYAFGQITDEEYKKLMQQLQPKKRRSCYIYERMDNKMKKQKIEQIFGGGYYRIIYNTLPDCVWGCMA